MPEQINLPEWPDLEDFMVFSQHSRIDGGDMNKLLRLWTDWLNLVQACRISEDKKSWLAIWLPESVEKELDALWTESPSQGYLANTLAQFFCMSAVREALPQIAEAGCAPAPKPELALKDGLIKAGLDVDTETGNLKRRFAIVTWHPFRGGCEVCSLQQSCPKISGSAGLDMVIPGHEPERA